MSRAVTGTLAVVVLTAAGLLGGCGGGNDQPPKSVVTSRPADLDVALAQGKKWNTEMVEAQTAKAKAEEDAQATANSPPPEPLPDFGKDAVHLRSGLVYLDEQVGTGPEVKVGDTIVVDYVGTFPNGKVFDASAQHGGSTKFALKRGALIEGWIEGIAGMKVGGKRKLGVPSELAYGDQRSGPVPPHSNLIFVVTLKAINPTQ